MQTIYKYELKITDDQTIELTSDYQILKVAEQNGTLYLWAIIDPHGFKYPVKIRIFGTGDTFLRLEDEFLSHLGSVLMSNGFVWHVFQVDHC